MTLCASVSLVALSLLPLELSAATGNEVKDLYALSLNELINIEVVTATGRAQAINEAPALMAVITDDDIAFWHYHSVAEAIASVPGIYCIDDRLNPNCGVRGVSGGFRGYSKIIKVLINGMPTAFRSDSNNYLGPELIPMSVVERIEIIKGPTSALYGADAFLGVINIVTKRNPSESEGQIAITSGHNAEYFQGNYFREFQNNALKGGMVFALSGADIDRSGLGVPDTVPERSRFSTQDRSVNDTSSPMSAFVQMYGTLDAHDIELNAHYSQLNTKAEFVDFGRFAETGNLGTEVRVALDSYNFNVQDTWQWNDTLGSRFLLGYATGRPSSKENIDVGLETSVLQRDFGYEAFDAVTEVRWSMMPLHFLLIGADYTQDNETLFESVFIDRATDTITINGVKQGGRAFYKHGYYLQYEGELAQPLSLVANVRKDDHNIYGEDNNYRVGVVYRVSSSLNAKLLRTSSYKAPAALQLYGQPLFDGEVGGNADLEPEQADSSEAQLHWLINRQTALTLGVFRTTVDKKVELLLRRANQVPVNRGAQSSQGIEFSMKWQNVDSALTFSGAIQKSEIESIDTLGQTFDQSADLYPEQKFSLLFRQTLNEVSSAGVEVRAVSPRRASVSNITLNSGVPYQLDAYQLANLVYNHRFDDVMLGLRLDNVFDEDYVEPGFAGVDIPGQARTTSLTVDFFW